MTARQFFEHLHYRSAQRPLPLWLWPLLPLCWGYALLVGTRLLAYRLGLLKSYRVAAPLLSVGNITTGGTGKTPIVIAIARYLISKRKRVLVLSRGYGAKSPQTYARATTPDYGDEAHLIQQAVPEAIVIVGKNRLGNARRAVEEFQPDVILLDDGYQYLKLARDINLLLVDATNGFGNGRLLPLGPLREPLGQLKRASKIVLTKAIAPEPLRLLDKCIQRHAGPGAFTLPPAHWPFETVGLYAPHDPLVVLNQSQISQSQINNENSIALCGIAQPDSFLETLCGLGFNIKPERQFIFTDHHEYNAREIEAIVARHPHCNILTTGKDWVKLQHVMDKALWRQVFCVEVAPRIEPYALDELLAPILATPV